MEVRRTGGLGLQLSHRAHQARVRHRPGGRGEARADGRCRHGDDQPFLRDARTAACQGQEGRAVGAGRGSAARPAHKAPRRHLRAAVCRCRSRKADDADPGVSGGGARHRCAVDGVAQERRGAPSFHQPAPACRRWSAGRRSAEHDGELDRRRQKRGRRHRARRYPRGAYPAKRRSCTLPASVSMSRK